MDDHCQIVRDEFNLLDKHSQGKLATFFLRYKFFSTNDLSIVLSLSSRYLRRLKSRAKITNSRKTSPPRNIKVMPDIKLEPGWDCKEWWEQHYPKYSAAILAKITGLHKITVLSRIRKYGIPMRSKVNSGHQCCNYDWLYKHYITLEWGLVRCGKAAGVSPDTISVWLNNHKIQVRSKYGPSVGKAARIAAGANRHSKVLEYQAHDS